MPSTILSSRWLIPLIGLAGLVVFSLAESLRPLRRRREPRLRRLARNLTMAGLGLATVEILQVPILVPVSRWTSSNGFGLVRLAPVSPWARAVIAILALDYTLWIWHRINHRMPFFWRFHSVHHVDRDMDASTGVRFHFGELGLSVLFRAGQIVLIGPDPIAVAVYQAFLFASVLFHHSNLRLPVRLERALVRVIVTPRMHGIHHSDRRNETDTNFSSLLSAWDYLHGSIRLDIPQGEVEIGVPAFQAAERVTLGEILVLPFRRRRQEDDWKRVDGPAAIRYREEGSRVTLLP